MGPLAVGSGLVVDDGLHHDEPEREMQEIPGGLRDDSRWNTVAPPCTDDAQRTIPLGF